MKDVERQRTCDLCGNAETRPERDFERNGWREGPNGQDICPRCTERRAPKAGAKTAPEGHCYLAYGPYAWGKAPTDEEAVAQCRKNIPNFLWGLGGERQKKTTPVHAFVAPADVGVDGMGRWTSEDHDPTACPVCTIGKGDGELHPRPAASLGAKGGSATSEKKAAAARANAAKGGRPKKPTTGTEG